MTINYDFLPQLICEEALNLGFNLASFCQIQNIDERVIKTFEEWLQKDYYGTMNYLLQNQHIRINPSLFFDEAKTIFIFLANYNSTEKNELLKNARYKIARFAHGLDYHHVLKNKLTFLQNKIKSVYPEFKCKIFVDSSPILEKYWAAATGLGWIGKNSLLINEQIGSFVFICGFVTNLETNKKPIQPTDLCGNCDNCINSCPNEAILPDRTIDARKCIAYLTIEARIANLPSNLKLENWIWGCDICQEVCPYNQNKEETSMNEFQILEATKEICTGGIIPDQLLNEEFLKKTPFNRRGIEKLIQNLSLIKSQQI